MQTAIPVDKKSGDSVTMYHPASLRSDGGRLRLDCVATLPWSTWQASCGLGGGFLWMRWQKSVEYASYVSDCGRTQRAGKSMPLPCMLKKVGMLKKVAKFVWIARRLQGGMDRERQEEVLTFERSTHDGTRES